MSVKQSILTMNIWWCRWSNLLYIWIYVCVSMLNIDILLCEWSNLFKIWILVCVSEAFYPIYKKYVIVQVKQSILNMDIPLWSNLSFIYEYTFCVGEAIYPEYGHLLPAWGQCSPSQLCSSGIYPFICFYIFLPL